MSRFLISVGGTLACVLAALFFLPQFIEWNHYRSVFEEEASRLLGRSVRVGGEVNLRLLPTPYIRFDRVRVAGTRSGEGEPLLKADEFRVRLAVAPLFRGALEATRVELTRPVLTLIANDRGGGNWSNIADTRPHSMFMPRSVALHDVRITDGTVVLKDVRGGELLRFEAGTADFAATGLEGPYKLHALLKSIDGPREVRLSTAKAEGDGVVRFKGVLRGFSAGPSYTMDGQLSDLTGRTRITGELTASLPIQGSGPADRTGQAGPGPSSLSGHGAFDLRATVKADTEGAQLSDLSLSFDNGGSPQFATGDAKFFWRHEQPARIRLNAQWLDLDRITGSTAEQSPLGLAARIAASIDQLMPSIGLTQAVFTLDQATLGGEVVSAVKLVLDKVVGGLRLRELRANLPGGTRLESSGTMTPAQSDAAFDGHMTVRGGSFNRFLSWVGRGQGLPDFKHDGSFAARGRVTIGAGRIAGKDVILQLAGNAVSGEASWNGETRQLALTVDATELDISPLARNEPRLGGLLASLLPEREADPARGQGQRQPAHAAPRPVQSTLRVRAGRLVIASLVLRDVAADVDLDGDSLKVGLLKFASDDGLAAEMRGSVTGLAGNEPKGNFAGDVSATRAAGLQRLLDVLGLPGALQPSLRRAEALVPVRLGGVLSIVGRGASAFDVSVDGSLANSRVSARMQLDNSRLPWRERRLDATASIESAEISPMLGQLLPEVLAVAAEKDARTPARVALRAAGVPARGVVSLITADAPGFTAEFRGRVAVDETAAASIEGETRIAADDLGRATALVGLGHRRGLDGLPTQLVLAAKSQGSRLRLEATKAAFGPTQIAGHTDIDFGGEQPRAQGRLRVSEISLPRLIALPDERPSAEASLWPESALDFSLLSAFNGKLRIETPALTVAPGLGLTGAALEAQLNNGRLGIVLTSARTLGGTATGKLAIEQTPAGASVQGEVQLAKASLEAATTADKPVASGEFSAQLHFSSVALSLRGLVAAVRGKGVVTLERARLNRMSPAAINSAALAALSAQGDDLAGELRRRLSEELGGGTVVLGQRKVALEIADGVIRAEPMLLETPDGRVTASTTIDLESLSFDSEWRLEPKPVAARAGSRKGSLPGVTLVYAGRLSQLASAEPRLQIEALERELSVRKMERYVEELERLRRQDEERVRHEAERLRNLELERQRLEDERLRALRRSALEAPGGSAAPDPAVQAGQQPNATQPGQQPSATQPGQQPNATQQSGASEGSAVVTPPRVRPKAADLMRELSDRSN